MADFDKEFFEGVKDGVTKGKIEYINIAGISPEVAELRHVKFRLPASKMHMNHVGMVYAGSYFVFVEATGASLIKCLCQRARQGSVPYGNPHRRRRRQCLRRCKYHLLSDEKVNSLSSAEIFPQKFLFLPAKIQKTTRDDLQYTASHLLL